MTIVPKFFLNIENLNTYNRVNNTFIKMVMIFGIFKYAEHHIIFK